MDFNAILSGSNTINNYSTAIMQAAGADAVRPGVNGIVFNAGTMKSTSVVDGTHHGIIGGTLNNTVIFTMSITNNAGDIIKGNDGAGINSDGFNNKESVTVINNGTIIGNGITGDGDGVDVDGLVNLNNTGVIRSLNSLGLFT